MPLAAGKDKGEAKAPADAGTALAARYGGKVWVQREAFPATEGRDLAQYLAQNPHGPAEIARATKDGPWSIHYVAVFKRPAAKGPMTVQFFDKADPGSLVDQYSPPNDGAVVVFPASFELDPDRGFNKGRTYLIKVGQLIKNKFVAYATGEMVLK